jgi:hypothetical protein
VNSAGNAEVLQNSLTCDIGSSSSEFLCQRGLNQGHPASHSLDLVSWREHSAVCALDQLASSLASLASSPRASFLRHYLTILPYMGCHEYIIPSRTIVSSLRGAEL